MAYSEIIVALILGGTLAHWMLYGVLLAQICFYYTAFPNDHRLLKQIVLLVFALETIQTGMLTQSVFRALAHFFNEPWKSNEINTLWFSVPFITSWIAFLTQVFYCYRIAILSKSKYAVVAIIALSASQLAAGIATTIQTKNTMFIFNLLQTKISLITIGIWGISSTSCDMSIAIIMVYYLKRRDTGFRGTHSIVKRLIRLTIETGLITASFATVTLGLAYIQGNTPYYQIGILIMAKLYSNSMIAALNSRMKVESNTPFGLPPSWNESVLWPMGSFQGKISEGIVFFKDECVSIVDH